MVETCESCKFAHILWRKGETYIQNHGAFKKGYEATRRETAVQCRIRAPMMSAVEGQYDGWPHVTGDDWCGEHQPKGASNG